MNEQQPEQPEQKRLHQVVADGQVIYEGDDWPQVFLGASMNSEWGKIVYVCDGKPGAQWGPPINLVERGFFCVLGNACTMI